MSDVCMIFSEIVWQFEGSRPWSCRTVFKKNNFDMGQIRICCDVQYSTVQYGGTTSTNVPAAHDDVDEDPNPAGDEHH